MPRRITTEFRNDKTKEMGRFIAYNFKLHVFPGSIVVVFAEEHIRYAKFMREKEPFYSGAIDYLDSHGEVFIKLRDCDMINVAHEATHATQMILQHIEYKNNEALDEIPAYLNGYIVQEISKCWELHKKYQEK